MGEICESNEYTLFNFAFCGSAENQYNMFQYLKDLAEPEIWDFEDENGIDILRSYIYRTFERCNRQNKILYSKDYEYCCANTGLLTPNGKDIVMFFTKNMKDGSKTLWYFQGYKTVSDYDYLNTFDSVPELATYTDNLSEYTFDSTLPIETNMDHILDDNWERIHEVVGYNKQITRTLLIGALEIAKQRVKRNFRLVVPQFYNDTIQYFMPIQIPVDDGWITMALALEKTPYNKYRANTIFDIESAYEKARLLMKQDNNWLKNADSH